MLKTLLTLILTVLLNCYLLAQNSAIHGTVKDSSTGEPIPMATVKVEGLNKGSRTDFDGNYELNLPEGTFVLIYSMNIDGYISIKREVKVIKGKEIVLNINLRKDSSVLHVQEMKVVAQKISGAKTVAADDARRRAESGATDGVTNEQMKTNGVSNAAEAVQMAPGLSVEDGKNVYVRGLGDRYTKTVLNGMEIPGLDPDRNSVQMDIFPVTVIDNITVYKTFTPNLAGDFTGGLVDITTKDFPSKKTFYINLGLGYNSEATFNKDYISYKGGKLDFLGFDDGTRALPIRTTDKFTDPVLGDPSLTALTSSFSKTMAAEKSSNFLDQNYAISLGDRISKRTKKEKKIDYGYNAVLNYRNTHTYYDSVQFNEYRKESSPTEYELYKDRSSKGALAQNDVMWSALFGQSLRINNNNKLSLTVFHTQNGVSSTSAIRQENNESNPAILAKQSLQFTQRSITNANINGRHYIDKAKKWKLDWKLSPTYSKIDDPDMRSTVLEELETPGLDGEIRYELNPSVGSEIRRMFRYMNEYNVSGRFDLTYSFNQWDSIKSELSFGALNTYKHRNFEVYDYIFNIENSTGYSGDPDMYFQEENIWTPETDTGTYGMGEHQLANSYVATQNVTGAYIMNKLPFSSKFKATYGVRVEKVINKYTGENNLGNIKYDNEIVLDELNLLPSVNLVYKIEKKKGESRKYSRFTNFRGAYAMTVARPSFKEKSIAQVYDPIQERRFNGNIDLKQTTIHNADFRWEHFYGRTELISASVFYKRFIDPIEVVANVAAPNEVQPVNAGVADVYGIELEARKAIGFKRKSFIHFVVGANFTYVLSRIDMNQVKTVVGGVEYTEKEVRQSNARDGEVISDYRQMYGQSPYIVNGFITFKNDSLGLTFNLSYNVQGKKLAVIGVGSLPDVYEQPFHSLNLKVSKAFGSEGKWTASLSAKNLLLSSKQRLYESFKAKSRIYDSYYRGMNISASIAFLIKDWK
ncbi:MAG: carboxypeptidase-like regulatory domain-containing protein [Crocinitomicaceae bacterium]|nr:carboxypeptidase-like regulatory domain-containing protein [Crocinitomicaceae bacterium]